MPLQKIIRFKNVFYFSRLQPRDFHRKDFSVNVFFVVSSFADLCNLFLLFSVLNINSVCYRRFLHAHTFCLARTVLFLLAMLEMRIRDSSSFTYDNISWMLFFVFAGNLHKELKTFIIMINLCSFCSLEKFANDVKDRREISRKHW